MLLDAFDPNEELYIDCETTSFDDEVEAFMPYHGHKIAGIAIGQKGVDPIYLPLRHRQATMEGNECLPYMETVMELREFCENVKSVTNINMKFDLHFLCESDGIVFPSARIRELKVKARLVNNWQENFRLETLALIYCKTEQKSSVVKEWCDLHGTKDYGMVPIPLISEYAKQDIRTAMQLDDALEVSLSPDSREVWDIECRFMPILFRSEQTGVPLIESFFRRQQRKLLYAAVKVQDEIAKIVTEETAKRAKPGETGMDGNKFNPGSTKQVNEYMTIVGIPPLQFTEKNNPQWNKIVFEQMAEDYPDEPLAKKLAEFNKYTHAEGTFCTGWLREMDAKGRMHPSFDSGGTATGRLSCRKPNFQNPPKWVWEGIPIPAGYIGVKFDASQIEYRIAAHYGNDPGILKIFRDNPHTDYHQIFADLLGIPRAFTKMLNFAILYGIGVKKLVRNIISAINKYDSDTLRKNLRRYVAKLMVQQGRTAEELVPDYIKGDRAGCAINREVLMHIAKAIIDEYHGKNPWIKALLRQIKDVIYQRGFIKNYFGRRYYFTPDKAYVALNYLCQGTAADIFKRGVVEIYEDPIVVASGAQMVTNIHDSVFAIVPIANAQAYWDVCVAKFGKIPATPGCPDGFRVPILIDGEVAVGSWDILKLGKIRNNDVLASLGMVVNAHAA